MNLRSPFPGMNPYLEHPTLWPDVHNRLITALGDVLTPQVAPHYYVGVESRAYVIRPDGDAFLGRPDLAVARLAPSGLGEMSRPITAETTAVLDIELPTTDSINHYYLEIRAIGTHELITVVELLSPVNKVDLRGRAAYLEKRADILSSRTNLVELDLLRTGEPMPLKQTVVSDYRLLVSPSWKRPRVQLYAFGLRAPIPAFPLPLLPQDDMPEVQLNEVVHDVYRRARFDLRLDYGQPPVPPLNAADTAWAANRTQDV